MPDPPGPNPLAAAWSMLAARRTRRPRPSGSRTVDHDRLRPVLEALGRHGVAALPGSQADLDVYRKRLEAEDPDSLTPQEALAYWINLYNAGALHLAAIAVSRAVPSVLRVPGAFRRPWATVRGETLSLDDIEHGKIRRFGDPRIHAALVCGSASCPTLHIEPFMGGDLDDQLDHQMRFLLAGGAAVADHAAGVLRLGRIFKWYGGDFTRPQRMPTWWPARSGRLAATLTRWLDRDTAEWVSAARPSVEFLSYDWSLACNVA